MKVTRYMNSITLMHIIFKHLTLAAFKLPYLSSVLSDTLPQWFEHAVEGLDTVRGGGLSQRGQGESSDGTYFLLLIDQS